MNGSILGFDEDAGEGAIRTEDGERFTFSKTDWKGDRDPKAGDKVDFVEADGKATEIYLLKGSFNGPDLSGIGDKLGDADSRAEMVAAVKNSEAVGLLMTKPHVAGAVLIILGWFFAGHLFLIFEVGKMLDGMGDMNRMASAFGGDSGIGLFRSIGVLSLLLFYVVPFFAGWLVFKSIDDKETGKNKRYAAMAGLILPIAIPIIAFFFIFIGLPSTIRSLILEGAGQAGRSGMSLGDMVDIDLGWLLMIAGGGLIVLQIMGIVKSFGGK